MIISGKYYDDNLTGTESTQTIPARFLQRNDTACPNPGQAAI